MNIFDLLLLSVKSRPLSDTDEFEWRESRPCSEKLTRVLGINQKLNYFYKLKKFSSSYSHCGGEFVQPDRTGSVATGEGGIIEAWVQGYL